MRKALAITAATLCAFRMFSAPQQILVTTGTNATATVTKYADPFIGDIAEVAVYTGSGVTGAVSIVALDSFSGTALVLATNAAASGYLVFTPRVDPAAVGGSSALTITNTATADLYRAQGERIYATVTAANAGNSNQTFRFRVKVK